jgi:abortive infection bacteriophage resistance protein
MLSNQDIQKIEDITAKLQRELHQKPSHDDILARITFGFWCSFFHRKYDPILWHRKDAIITIFPNLQRINRKRSYIEHKVLEIKYVRNRIAHHEPIWNDKVPIIYAHRICHELIEAMANAASEMLKKIDRFPVIYLNVKNTILSI